MRQDDQVSRYEVNRSVRMVITRHDADLARIEYSFLGSTVYLSGDLVRPNGEFSAQEVENIVRELAALPHVRGLQFDLNNWLVDNSGDSWQVNRIRKTVGLQGAPTRTGISDETTLVIEREEDLQTVLDDIGEKSKRKS